MAKVLLVQPNINLGTDKTYETYTPLNLIFIGTYLKENDHEVRIFDRSINKSDEDFIKEVKRFNPNIMFASMITGKVIFDCIQASKLTKENSNALIIWGGILPTLRPDIVLNNQYVDFIIRGECEEVILDISNLFKERNNEVRLKQTISTLKNINHNPSRERLDLNKLPLPDYDLVDINKYSDIIVMTSRGCPYRCSFCYIEGYWKKLNLEKWRGFSANKTIDMITSIAKKYKRKKLGIYDDMFPADRKRAIDICNGISNLDLELFIFARVNYTEDNLMKAYKKAGVLTIQMGLETGSERILKFLKKDITLQQMRDGIKQCKKYGILSQGSFMIGLPTETVEDLNQTVRFIKQNKPDYAGIVIYHPCPETPLYDYCIESKLIKEPKSLEEWGNTIYHWANINVSKIPTDVLLKTKVKVERIMFTRSYIKKFVRTLNNGNVPSFTKIYHAGKHLLNLYSGKLIQ